MLTTDDSSGKRSKCLIVSGLFHKISSYLSTRKCSNVQWRSRKIQLHWLKLFKLEIPVFVLQKLTARKIVGSFVYLLEMIVWRLCDQRYNKPGTTPCLRLKNSKSTKKCQVFSSTLPARGKNRREHSEIFSEFFFQNCSWSPVSRIVPKNVNGDLKKA